VAFEAEHLNRNGTPHYFDFSVKPVTDDAGKVIMLIPEGRDITARKQAEERIKQQADFFQRLIDSMPYPVFYKDRQGLYLSCNHAFEKFYGVRRDQITGKTVYAVAPKERAERHTRIDKELLSQSGSRVYEARVQSDDGANHDVIFHKATFQTQQGEVARNYRIVSSPICNAAGQVLSAIELVEDITEKHFLESQLRQAQKMEAVGRLAGGVAHDFNNMLSVILGYAELALYKLEASHPVHAKLVQIRDAAQRSTDIIRQLLAFARKQTIAPQMLDLNEAVEGVLKMLRRLIGEDIDLVWRSDSGLWPVKMDPTQIEQILANLCVNARDAIQGIGKITIETSNVNFDEAYCQDHAGFQPGRYVMLAVSDDGCGMDPDTLEKIFEPFFTTKGVGRGTGLGLSTVYGQRHRPPQHVGSRRAVHFQAVYRSAAVGQGAQGVGKDSVGRPIFTLQTPPPFANDTSFLMVGVAQLVEHLVVAQVAVGSSPITHPIGIQRPLQPSVAAAFFTY
jgi:PAS domain S-box-containing protein